MISPQHNTKSTIYNKETKTFHEKIIPKINFNKLVSLPIINQNDTVSTVELVITEGRNHIVKNIFKELGYKVLKLKRVTYGFLTLDGLKKGEYRNLSIKEVKILYSYKNNQNKRDC